MKPTKAQIGRAGELLVQMKLLMHGIESAPLTTDSGIDLVAFSDKRNDAITVQVKSNLSAKPGGGGKGKLHLDWWVPENSPAELYAFVDLSRSRVWLIKSLEVVEVAQQHPKDRYHFFYGNRCNGKKSRDGKPVHEYEFERYLLENRLHELF